LVGWVSVAIAALLFIPSVASAAYALTGETGQGLPASVRVSSDLWTVTRFTIEWRATCTNGGSLSSSSVAKRIAIWPFPNFHRSGSYVFSAGNVSNGQPVRALVSAQLRGKLMLNARASGTWTVQARVLDANGNQVDTCRTGVVRWRAAH
jgi:hypothetical protein